MCPLLQTHINLNQTHSGSSSTNEFHSSQKDTNIDIHRATIFTFRKSEKTEDSLCFLVLSVCPPTNPMRKRRLPLDRVLYTIEQCI